MLLFSATAQAQGVTTSSIAGVVTDQNGEALFGANVVAVHQPSGTTYGVSTDSDGNFRITGMRVGGPYKITVSYAGFNSSELENLNLRLGEVERRNFELRENVTELESLVVSAQAGSAGETSGTSTQISSQNLEELPTLDRDINDFLRLTPQSGSFGGGTTFAGMNNRYNAIYIDGAVNNDVFGLASSGTNGGQTGISPFSLDILDQLQVVLSPYDVTYGGFAGGGVNAVTKSGTNTYSASVYQYYKNENLVGKTNEDLADRLGGDRTQVDEFTERQLGLSLSGPIIEDKLFFFTNIELQRDATPVPFDPAEYTSADGRASVAVLENLRSFLIDEYNYNPGSFGSTSRDLDGEKLFFKLDYNINENHFLTLRHQYTKAEQFSRNAGNSNTIEFSNSGVFFPSTTNSSAIELNSFIGDRYSNNLILSYVRVRDNRGTLGSRFPYVDIADGAGGAIEFGSEQFSTANQLDQDIFAITNNFKLFRGDHTITLGTHNEFYDIYNLFLRQNFGAYEYNSIDDLINNARPADYNRTYAISGDGAAAFNAMQLGLYAQDEWRVNRDLTLTAGLRLDVPIITSNPPTDTNLRDNSLPAMARAYDVAGEAQVGNAPDGQLMLSPRLGFNYILPSTQIPAVIRGGAGLFTSRIPFVWPGAMFNNNGLNAGSVDIDDLGDDFRFIADPDNQPTNPNAVIPSGQVDLFTEDFKYPQILRSNLATDIELPGGVFATFEGMYTRTLNNITYTNVNSDPTTAFRWTGSPDTRQVFTGQNFDNTYSGVYVASNTSRGHTYNLGASFAKNFDFGLNANLAYSWNDSYSVTDGTSSQNSSQWRGQVSINGRNNPEFGRSDFAIGHRIIAALSQRYDWKADGNNATTVSLFANIQSEGPFSYVIAGRNARNLNNETGSTSNNRSLVYIPASAGEINLIDYTLDDGTVVTAAEQWENLNAVIEDDSYLSDNRGSYAEKNASWLPFSAIFDFSIRQDFGLEFSGQRHRFQLSADIFNVANLLNPSWGTRYATRGSGNYYDLYIFEGYEADGTTPQFTYRDDETGLDRYDIQGNNSRWQMQFGVRYLFN
ncbi:MAG: TonB-dependent receptor [Cyclonatronaceae bacterium]